jgi:ElaB/YqjD/DUF883 family membrane-anchored ribosome-binding protein
MNKHHGLRDMFQPADNATRTMRELRSTASYGGSEIESARDSLKHQLEAAREHAKGWERAAWDRARHASHAADEYVHENAWKSLAGAALIGVLAGVCLMSDHKRR